MKKAILHISIFILFSAQMACSHGEDEPEDITTISVNEPGSLSEIIVPSQRGCITKLAVKGSLNYSDISYIRQMPELLYLDVGSVVLPNNYFPDNAISSHEKLEAVILPVSLDSIGGHFDGAKGCKPSACPKNLNPSERMHSPAVSICMI